MKKTNNLTISERLEYVSTQSHLTAQEQDYLSGKFQIPESKLDSMIENAIGTFSIPLGVATNFKINGMDRLVPMATEEPSVISVVSKMAQLAAETGGFFTSYSGSIMIGQIQVVDIADPFAMSKVIYENKEKILEICNTKDPTLVSLGGGAKDIEVQTISTPKKVMLVIHLLIDTKDAMGANAVNTMAEATAAFIESITNGRVILRILSNFADRRLVRARAVFRTSDLGGINIVNNILDAYELAEYDPYRATTHNKGIMNGISAVVTATGNDTRAVEAGVHAYAARSGRYSSLTKWELNREGNLTGSIEIPLAVGTVGGATRTNPTAQAVLKVLGVTSAEELAGIMASVGLAQNLGWMHALASDGIQKGHMALHARNLAYSAGVAEKDMDKIIQQVISENDVRYDRILELKNLFA
jgi:hydroxymethylglutaryl-CoA reductase